MEEQTDSGEAFTILDVAFLILEAVGVLHSRGHQLLRIYPGMSGSGMYWRTAITHATNYTHQDGYTHLSDFDAAFHYTTGAEFEVAGERVEATTTPTELADRIVAALPDPGLGRDWEYAGWYVELLGLVRRHHSLPIAYADYFDGEPGWEIGWGSGHRISHPPSVGVADEKALPQYNGKSTFTGTLKEFNRYLGPHWRVLVQQITKKHKATIGACEFHPSHKGPFDAAHIHGRERTTLLRELLGNPTKDDILTVDIIGFEASFKEEHHPIEKSILVLCKSCHQKYDSSPNGVAPPAVSPTSGPSEPDAGPGEIPPGTLVLPITLEPRSVETFKLAILASKAAWIDVSFRDGHVERQPWLASKLTEASNLIANLRARPNFRQGKWQELGIVAVHVTVAEADIARTGVGPTNGN